MSEPLGLAGGLWFTDPAAVTPSPRCWGRCGAFAIGESLERQNAGIRRPQWRFARAPKDHINRRISQSGSKVQQKRDTRPHMTNPSCNPALVMVSYVRFGGPGYD